MLPLFIIFADQNEMTVTKPRNKSNKFLDSSLG